MSDLWASQTSRASSQPASRVDVEPELRSEVAPIRQNEGADARVEIQPEILITDDGRTLEAPKTNLICPFCQKEYLVMICPHQ